MRSLPVLAAATAAAALLLLSAAGPAAAQNSIRLFKVTAEGSGTFSSQQLLEGLPGLPSEIDDAVEYSWKVRLPAVAFLPSGQAVPTGDAAGAVTGTLTGKATHETVLRGLDGQGNVVVTRGTCTAAPQSVPVTGASIVPGPLGTENGEPGGHLEVTPHQVPAFAATCEGPLHPPTSQLGVHAALDAITQRFFLPAEATRMGKIIQLVQAGPGQKDQCTLQNATCSFDWSGKLTFEFAGYLDQVAPPPPPPPGGITEDDIPMPPPPADPLDDIFIPLPGSAKVRKGGKRATVDVRCTAACSGSVRALRPRGAKGAAAAARPLATARFSAAAGETVRVTLRFAGKARRAVRRAGAVRLVIAAGEDRRTVVARR